MWAVRGVVGGGGGEGGAAPRKRHEVVGAGVEAVVAAVHHLVAVVLRPPAAAPATPATHAPRHHHVPPTPCRRPHPLHPAALLPPPEPLLACHSPGPLRVAAAVCCLARCLSHHTTARRLAPPAWLPDQVYRGCPALRVMLPTTLTAVDVLQCNTTLKHTKPCCYHAFSTFATQHT